MTENLDELRDAVRRLRHAAEEMLKLEEHRMFEKDVELDAPAPCPCSGCARLRKVLKETECLC